MLPILLTQFAQAGYGLVDTIMAGRVSADDLAVVSIGAGLWLPVFFFTIGVLIATTPLLGELIGKKQPEKIPNMVQQSLWLALFLGLLASFTLYCLPWTFDWFDVPSALQNNTSLYLRWVSVGFVALALSTSLRCYTESLGHPLAMTVISLLGVLINIPLNYIFIHGKFGMPALGGAGCGVATACVLWLTFFILAGYLAVSKKYADVRFYKNFNKPTLATIKKIAFLGIPIGTSIFFEASLFSIAAVVLSPLGAVTVSAHQVALSITSQFFMIPLSLGLALTIIISKDYGKQNWLSLRANQKIGFVLATLLAFVGMVIILIFKHQLATFYTEDTRVIELASQLLLFAAIYQIVDAWQVVSAGILRGIQDTATPMWITFFSYWCVALPIGVYLSRYSDYGAQGFWVALVIGLTLAAFLLMFRIKHKNKQLSHK